MKLLALYGNGLLLRLGFNGLGFGVICLASIITEIDSVLYLEITFFVPIINPFDACLLNPGKLRS